MAINSLDSIHILHVDDEPDFADMAGTFLEREDDRFDVEVATGPSEAVDRLDAERFDCVVSDYDMPGRNGIELLETVREDYPDIPFILFTGKGSEEVASDAISAGVTDYLQKGSETSQYTVLANRIRNAVDKYYTQTKLAEREKRLNLFFEQSPLGVVEWDEQFNFVRINDAGEDILGYTQDDLMGHSWEKIVPESDRDAVTDVVADLLENKGGYHSINENVRKDGERIVCEWHNRVVTDDDKNVVSIFSQFQDITERKRRERENDRQRHRLEQILKTVPGCVVQLDADGQFVFANERAEEVLGVESDKLTDRAYNDPEWHIRDPDGEPIPDEELPFRRVRDSGEPVYSVRHTIQWPDGTRKVLLVNGAPLFDEDGVVDSVVFSLTDITEQQNRERELRKARRRLELALETTDTGVFEWNMRTDEVTWSDSLERVMGLEPGEFEGTFEAFIDRVHPDDLPRVQEQIDHAVETESVYQTEFRMRTADGSYQWVEVRGQVIRDREGERMVGVHHDITERKNREQELQQSNARVEALFEHSPDMINVHDMDGNIIDPNPRLCEQTGYDADTLTDMKVWDIDQAIDPDEVHAIWEQMEVGDRHRLEGTYRRRDGSTFPVEVHIRRFRLDGEDRVLVISRDITDQKRREETLRKERDRLEEFASVISHDLRNPLKVAEGRVELAQEECESEHLDDAESALERSQALIGDLLTLAREGRRLDNIEAVDLGALTENCWRNVATGEATVSVEIERTIRADQSRLQQLLENLFRNAIEHGGNDVAVTVGGLANGFYVEDSGPGIPAAERDEVFDAGYSTTEDGTGFGLSIVKEIADAHGWDIHVTEGSDGGARFEITGVEFSTE